VAHATALCLGPCPPPIWNAPPAPWAMQRQPCPVWALHCCPAVQHRRPQCHSGFHHLRGGIDAAQRHTLSLAAVLNAGEMKHFFKSSDPDRIRICQLPALQPAPACQLAVELPASASRRCQGNAPAAAVLSKHSHQPPPSEVIQNTTADTAQLPDLSWQ
jgi:hypothetical protein